LALFELESGTVGNRLIEADSVRTIQDVDAPWRQANLQDAIVGGEILLTDLEVLKRRTELAS
jgi:hypothetical protein